MLYYKLPVVDGVTDCSAGSILLCAYPLDGYMVCKFESVAKVGTDWVEITAEEFDANCPEFSVGVPDAGAAVVPVTEDRTLGVADAGKFLRVDAAATIAVPADVFPVGVELEVFRNTSGAVTIAAGSGVSFAIPGNTKLVTESQTISDQYASIVLKHIDTNVWSIQGAI